MAKETPRVWVGCLACYNGGELVGLWFDAIDAPTSMGEFDAEITKLGDSLMASSHRIQSHEELWVMDHEGFAGMLTGECAPMEAQRIAELLESFDGSLDALGALMSNEGLDLSDAIEKFDEAFCGEYENGAGYAQELADEMDAFSVGGHGGYYSEKSTDVSDRWPFTCIDWSRAWRELEMGGDNYGVFVAYDKSSDGSSHFYVFRSI